MAIELQTGVVGHADRTDARANSSRYQTVIKADTYESLLVQLTEEVNKGRLILDGRKYLRIKKGNHIINI